MRVYHFFRDDGTTGEARLPVIVGETMRVEGKIVPCSRGLHGSVRAIDALRYAPGSMVQIAELGGTIVPHAQIGTRIDKYAASERTCIAKANVEKELRAFARWCALSVIDKWDAPQIVRDYLTMGDEKLRPAAWDAARDATRAAAWDAARSAAWDAARAATRAAAWDAARDAAWAAAWAAAWDAAWDAARDPAQTTREQAFCKAWDAEVDKQNEKLEALIGEALAQQNA
jgi:hypothetical protein